jgi:hypothetical protein
LTVDVDALWTRLTEPFRGRPVIVAFKVLASTTGQVQRLKEWGADRPLVIANGLGTGTMPSPEDADIYLLDLGPAASMSEEVQKASRLGEDPPADVARRVEAFDPDGRAVWWLPPFGGHGTLLGRPVFGGRPKQWARLEDKLICDEIWDAAGVPRSPMRIAPVERDALLAATAAVRGDAGAVWAGDAREGVNGGADLVRSIDTEADADRELAYFGEHCDRVRVMPFLEGVPCSIHGFVLADGVATFRPVELVIFRHGPTGTFRLGGMSSWWDPSEADRDEMRVAARRVGAVLADRVGYRGGFGIDGVLTGEGFRPTELNPRFTGGLMTLARGMPDVPFELLHLNVVAGRDPGIAAPALEELVVEAADASRFAHGIGISDRPWGSAESAEVELALVDGVLDVASDGAPVAGSMLAGPAVTPGTFVRFLPADGTLRAGDRFAPLHLQALRFADRQWGCAFGELEAAPAAR